MVHLHDHILKLCSTEGLCVEVKGGMHSMKEEFLEHTEQRSEEGRHLHKKKFQDLEGCFKAFMLQSNRIAILALIERLKW